MNKKELENLVSFDAKGKLQDLLENGDTEVAHFEADLVLRKMLLDLGYEEEIALYDQIEKWFA